MSASKTPHIGRLALLLGGLAMFGPFSIDTIFPAFPAIGADLAADKVAMQQTIAVYLVAYAVMSVIHGPLSDAIGRRRVILGGLTVFTMASVGCALSTDLVTLLAFRAVQGLSAGVGIIVGRAVIRDVLQGDDAQRLMSQVSMIFGIAPAIAPVIGGWILGWSDWPMIFWFLVAFSAVLLVTVWFGLPETHPPADRLPLHPRSMLRDYFRILLNARFQRLAAAGAFNFAALFLYIASAPAFVLDLLRDSDGQRLGATDFVWFFAPTIGGMMLGAFMVGSAAGKMSGARLANWGFLCCGAAAAANIGYNLLVEVPTLPWAIAPIVLNAFGIALVFPILTLAILDMYPRQRGSASSLQMFTGLVVHSIVAGVISPLLSGNALWLAIGAGVSASLAWCFWRWEIGTGEFVPDCPTEPAALEPTERL